ncbi:MAG: Spy/CpxP family protein refolding chaperone [Thermoanaerobaculia bacterium]
MTPRHRSTIAICGLILLTASLPALAQGRGDRRHGRGRGGMDGHRLEHLALRLELSDGQREELKELFAAGFETRTEARRNMFEARRALAEQIRAEAFDEAAIRKAAAAVAALEAERAVERALQTQKIRQILTPEQLAEFKGMRGERRRFERRGRRGGGFGGPPPVGE